MATLIELERAGELVKLDAGLEHDQPDVRDIYLFPNLVRWLAEVLPTMESAYDIAESPMQQVDALVRNFVAGEPLAFDGQFHALDPRGKGIWELKTTDVRIFGWFSKKDTFVGVSADDATRVKTIGLYTGHRDQAVYFRDTLDLDRPKFIESDHPHDVVSNWNFSPQEGRRSFPR